MKEKKTPRDERDKVKGEKKVLKAKLRLLPLGTVLSTLITFSLSFFRTLNGRWPLTHSDPRAEPSQRTIGWKKDVTQVM